MKLKTWVMKRVLLDIIDDFELVPNVFLFRLNERRCERMGGYRTSDGLGLAKILKFAESVGATVREGTNHPYVLNYDGLRPCPVASSTNARTMIVPWICEIVDYRPERVYQGLRKGKLKR